jgi:uncharacterized membrane protein YecN with MAPEG domain
MDIVIKALHAIVPVLLVGLLLGAGLPALFALGVRALYGTEVATVGTSESSRTTRNRPAGRVVAYLCFAVCVIAVLFGIVVLVFGKQLFGT